MQFGRETSTTGTGKRTKVGGLKVLLLNPFGRGNHTEFFEKYNLLDQITAG